MATEKWTTVHPIPWRNTSFTYLPWWIFDIIVAANAASEDWRDYAEEKYAKEFDTLKQAYIDYTDVDFIESRNGYLYKLSDFTPADATVTITPKTAPADFKVGDADLAATDLFTIDPSGTAMTLSVDSSGHASIVAGKLRAVSAGDVVVTATSGSVTATLTVNVKAQPVTITGKSPVPAFKVGDADLDAAALFDISPSNTVVVLTVESGTAATIVSGKLHAVSAGDVTVQCTAGSVFDSVTVTITA